MIKLMGLFVVIPASLLLTLSFFVLLALRKPEAKGLENIGRLSAFLLWVATAFFLVSGAYTITTGRCPMMAMMQKMKHCQMQGMPMGEKMFPVGIK